MLRLAVCQTASSSGMPRHQALFYMPSSGLLNWLGLGRRECVTLAADDIPWDIRPVPKRVVAVGDVHGDLVALSSILLERGLINRKGRWTGGKTHLVLNGDLVGGAGDSRLLADFVIRLEDEARRDAGAVHALLGNHDVLALGPRRSTKIEKLLFKLFPTFGAESASYAAAQRGDTRYAHWLRRRSAIIRLGDAIFVHGGLGDWAIEHDPGRVNASIRAWIRYFQDVDRTKPDQRSRWTIGMEEMGRNSPLAIGPLWTRVFAPRYDKNQALLARRKKGAPTRKALREILSAYGGKRMVVGHVPVKGREVLLTHPYYGEMVTMIDTRISAPNGRLSSIELRRGAITAHYTKRSKAARQIRDAELNRAETAATRARASAEP